MALGCGLPQTTEESDRHGETACVQLAFPTELKVVVSFADLRCSDGLRKDAGGRDRLLRTGLGGGAG